MRASAASSVIQRVSEWFVWWDLIIIILAGKHLIFFLGFYFFIFSSDVIYRYIISVDECWVFVFITKHIFLRAFFAHPFSQQTVSFRTIKKIVSYLTPNLFPFILACYGRVPMNTQQQFSERNMLHLTFSILKVIETKKHTDVKDAVGRNLLKRSFTIHIFFVWMLLNVCNINIYPLRSRQFIVHPTQDH